MGDIGYASCSCGNKTFLVVVADNSNPVKCAVCRKVLELAGIPIAWGPKS